MIHAKFVAGVALIKRKEEDALGERVSIIKLAKNLDEYELDLAKELGDNYIYFNY